MEIMLHVDGSPTMSELRLHWHEISRIAKAFRDMDKDANNIEEVSQRIVQFLYENILVYDSQEKACALIRLFQTQPFGRLEPSLQQYISRRFGHPDSDRTPCLTLMASCGVEPEWNSRRDSKGHQSIPLKSDEMLGAFPMIAQLFKQFGVELSEFIQSDPTVLVNREEKTYNVFHVEDAVGSPHVPDQENFVLPYGIKSVLGFGGMLPLGSMFAIILFSRAHIRREVAQLFVPLALSAKIPLLTFAGKSTFAR